MKQKVKDNWFENEGNVACSIAKENCTQNVHKAIELKIILHL